MVHEGYVGREKHFPVFNEKKTKSIRQFDEFLEVGTGLRVGLGLLILVLATSGR